MGIDDLYPGESRLKKNTINIIFSRNRKMDLITQFSITPQIITASAVSEVVNSFASDAARELFMREPYLIKSRVAVVAAGGAQGLRIEFRVATNAALTGSPLVLGDSGLLLPGQLETVGVLHQFRLRPIKLASGYDFWGIYYNVISASFSGGFALMTGIADEGPETADAPM